MHINVQGLSYVVGTHFILKNIGLEVPVGTGIRIRGRTGAGKSTLAQILSRRIPAPTPPGFEPFSKSWRYVDGQCIASQFDVPFATTYLPSDPFDILIYPSVRDCFPREAAQAQITVALSAVGLPATVINQDLWQLSGGMLQRLALARTRFLRPHVLIADQLHEWLDDSGRHMLASIMAEHVRTGGIAVALESTASPPAADFPALRLEDQQLNSMPDGDPAEWGSSSAQVVSGNDVALELLGVTKEYQTDSRTNTVLCNIRLSIYEGEWLGIRGANGAGKSVLARLIAGIEDSTAGTYMIFGRRASSADRLREVAYIFQMPSQLLPFPTIYDLVKQITPSSERTDVFARLAALGIRNGRRISDLSPAKQRLVGFELLMVKRPKVVILDEPTWGADADEVRQLMDHVRSRLSWPHVVILISHDAGLVATQCRRVVTVANGQLSEE